MLFIAEVELDFDGDNLFLSLFFVGLSLSNVIISFSTSVIGYFIKSDNDGGGFSYTPVSVSCVKSISILLLLLLLIEGFKLFVKALRLFVISSSDDSVFSVICYNGVLFY